MLSFLVFIWSILPNVQSQTICVWGRSGGNAHTINGEWIYQGNWNAAPVYTINNDPYFGDQYLWQYSNGRYYMTDYAPTSSIGSVRAQCNIVSSDPLGCGVNWIVGSEGSVDPNMLALASCPEWDCDEVTADVTYASCGGPFTEDVGHNAWYSGATRYFYFHPSYNSWMCGNSVNYGPASIYVSTVGSWQDVPKGGFGTFDWTYPENDTAHNINCVKYPTTSPTPAPTAFPTPAPTTFPTPAPTTNPTKYPTKYPTQYPTKYPTSSPSNDPSQSPTNIPSLNPSQVPSKSPTKFPTTTPSAAPTDQPTLRPSDAPVQAGFPTSSPSLPSSQPTVSPSTNPSFSPSTNAPSTNPSITPTNNPSSTPTKFPSVTPSSTPSMTPTSSPTRVTFQVEAQWTDTYLSINLNIKNNDPTNATIQLRYNSQQTQQVQWATNCGYYFDISTLYSIGKKSTCAWHVNPVILTSSIDISINLIYATDVALPNITLNSSLNIREGAFEYRYIGYAQWQVLNESLPINSILPANNPVQPNILSAVNTFLGICDGLILDASHTSNLGGRTGEYYWELYGTIVDPNNNNTVLYNVSNFTDNMQQFAWNELVPKTQLNLHLNVSSWFGQQNYQTWQIYKDNKPQPQILLDGPTLFSVSNDNYDGTVILTALIGFDDSCLQNNTANLPFKLEWSVSCNGCDNLAELQTFLDIKSTENNKKTDVISFIASEHLSVAATYTFTVNMTCIQNLECNTVSSLVMAYIFSEITCQISNADMYIYDIKREDFLRYNSLYLDGNQFTYDVDMPDKSNLVWDWQCLRNSYGASVPCEHILYDTTDTVQTITDSAVYVHFAEDITLEYNTQYLYTFTMTVSDGRSHISGRQCIDSTNLVVSILSKAEEIDWMSFNIEIIAANTHINIAESLRLMVLWNAINNDDNIDFTDSAVNVSYKWTENTNQLSADNINALNRNTGTDNGNLIISPGALSAGVYQFNVTISIYYDGIKIGESSSAEEIVVNDGAYITSFMLNPDCDNVTLDSLEEIFTHKYSLELTADTDNPPLSYGFSYTALTHTTYLQSQLLNRARLDRVLLPIGEFEVNGHVYDSDGTPSLTAMECNVRIDDSYDWKVEQDCINYSRVLTDYFNVSTIRQPYEIHKFIIYTTDIYIGYILNDFSANGIDIQYLYDYESDAYQCLKSVLSDTLDSMYEYFNFEQNRFCGNDYSVQLASVMSLWFDLRKEFEFWDLRIPKISKQYSRKDVMDNWDSYHSDSLDLEMFKFVSLIEQILDPCDYITDKVKQFQFLSVESESIVSNQRIIYYKNKDITHQLSPLLLEYDKYGTQLYAFAASVINLVSKIGAMDMSDYYLNVIVDIVDLVQKSLYISQLSRVSIAIAGENTFITSANDEFAITSIRYGSTSSNGVNLTTPYFEVLITDNDLLQYLSECEKDKSKSNALCNGDVIIIGFNSTQSNNTQFIGANVGNNCEELSGFGELGGYELNVGIVGQNVTDLDQNVTMTFNEGYDMDDIPVCVWWNNATHKWDESGCVTSVNEGSVICSCNHLTTFATIHALNTNEECLFTDEFHYVSLIFILCFIAISAYIICSIYPFYTSKNRKSLCREKAIVVFQLILTICIVNIFVCLFFFIVDNERNTEIRNGLIHFQIILLVLPLFIYFVLFALILYSWATVAHSLQVQDEVKLRFRLRLALCSSLSLVSTALIAQIILVPLGLFKGKIEQTAMLFWCGLLAVSALLYSIYGFLMVRLLVNTAKKMRNVVKSGVGSDMKLAKKLMISAVCIWLFFVLELVINLMFTFKWVEFTPWWRSFDLALNFGCLIIICYMYHASVKRLRTTKNAMACCDKPEQRDTFVASRTKDSILKKKRNRHNKTEHRKLESTSLTTEMSDLSVSTKKRKKTKKQISCVTITEITELNGQHSSNNTQLIMAYDDSKRQSTTTDTVQHMGMGLSALGGIIADEDEEDIVIDESLDMNNENVLQARESNNNMRLPPPLPPQITVDSNSEYEYEYYEEDENGKFDTNQNILYED